MSDHPTKSGGPIFRSQIFSVLVASNSLNSDFTEMHGCPFHNSVLVVNLIYKEPKIST